MGHVRLLACALLLALAVLPIGPPVPGAAGQAQFGTPTPSPAALPAGAQTLPGHVPDALAQAVPLPLSGQAAAEPVTVTVVLRRTDPSGFEAFRRGVETPGSPNFRHFLPQAELAGRFGPSQQAYDTVLAYLQQQGFTLVAGSTNRLTITGQGTRAQAEQVFGVQLRDYQMGGRTFRASSADPVVPASIAPLIQAVAGLSNLAVHHPRFAYAARPAAAAAAISPATPMSLATAYNFPAVRTASGAPANGAGQTIGLLEYDSFFVTDVQNWLSFAGLCAAGNAACNNGFLGRLTVLALTSGLSSPGDGETEVLLDLDTAIGMATGANYRVYESCNTCPSSLDYQAMFNRMLSDGVTVISNSWDECEGVEASAADVASIDSILQSAEAAGVSLFNATGDTGAYCQSGSGLFYPNTIDVPADSPHAIATGGTTLAVGANNVYQGETWWNSSIGAGGYGTSRFFAAPAYQAGLAGSARSVPDMVADADPDTGILICEADYGGCPQTFDGQLSPIAGTSMAAPAWAAGTALINQALGHLTGNWNVALYSERGTSGFHAPGAMGSDFPHVGIGSFNLGTLYAQLTASSTATPAVPPSATPVPTATAMPTATRTPLPPICTPRPSVQVTTTPSGAGRLQVTIAAATDAGSPPNRLVSLQFGAATNALIDVPGQPAGQTGNFTVTLPGIQQQLTFVVRRAAAGQSTTVPLTVQDGCGAWPTFVGGGPSAF